MAWFEDMVLGMDAFLPDYGKTGMDLSPEERRKLIEERMRGYTPLIPMISEAAGLSQKDLERRSAEEAEIQPMFGPSPDAAEESIDARVAQEETDKLNKFIEGVKTKRMQEEAYQRQLDPYSWLGGKGGADPAEKLQKLSRIREQAGGGGGGAFSQQADSPELQARLRERDEWTAGQPERDLMFAMTPEQAQRRPEYAASAGESLTRLRATKEAERRGRLQEQLVGSLAQSGGKIPFETAMKLDAAGMEVPWRSVGTSPQMAQAQLDDFGREAQAELSKFGSDQTKMLAPGAEQTVAYLQYMLSLIPQYKQLIEGGMDPDEAGKRFMEIAQRHGQDSGAVGFLMLELQKQQQAAEAK